MSSRYLWKSDLGWDALRPTPFTITVFLCACLGQAMYVTYNIRSIHRSLDTSPKASVHIPIPEATSSQDNIPHLFIFRRSKKTGSTTMLDALQRVLLPHGYVPLYGNAEETKVVTKSENMRPRPRRLLIANHNQVTKSFEKNGHAVIADTFRDGYQQITSYCRFFVKVKECDEKLIECLRSRPAIGENYYRWAYHNEEDVDVYVDLPLSAAHPALSTTVLRTVFPEATIEISDYNVVNSTCPEIPAIRKEYNKNYETLERQTQSLRKRMLILAGYPIETDPKTMSSISLEEMVDAAEQMEKLKYSIKETTVITSKTPKSQQKLMEDFLVWTKTDDDSVGLKPKFGGSH